MDEFHFLRPWWLLAAPVGVWLIWTLLRGGLAGGSWHKIVDAALHKYVLARPEVLTERRWPMLVALAGLALAVIALAGPAWERLPVPAYRSEQALVVALDLSRSMDAADLEPSRLTRARLKLLSLLDRREGGETALVVFSSHAFTVTPLTTDTRTVAALVGALYSDIMPSSGSYPEVGLEKAATLMEQAGIGTGEILLITDADVTDATRVAARDLNDEGFTISVLAVGTEEGAPIADSQGGFVTDGAGQVVIPRVNLDDLRSLARIGGGRFAQLSPDDRDLDALFPQQSALAGVSVDTNDESEYEADVWRDQGVWLALLLIPFVALAFRRGWVCVLLLAFVLPSQQAEAFEWKDLWQRPDQRGFEALQEGEAETAAQLFEDPEWRGVAEYRAGSFEASAAALFAAESTEGIYNRGNALAKSGQLEAALQAYDAVLERDPGHEDARYNRDLVQELLDQNQDQSKDDSNDQENQESSEGNQQQSADSSGTGDQGESGESEEQNNQQNQANNQSDNQSGQSDSEQDSDSSSDGNQNSDAQDSESDLTNQDQELQASAQQALPEDLEEWASDQAADQWLRRVPQDPAGLLRRKFLYQYQRLGVDQDGNYVWPGDEAKPW